MYTSMFKLHYGY